ncbi:hypothetical protein DFP93_102307 [Aneurinibacillus soli]|uniref:Uncharacterized protein n=1 Tax=Aneurinibacillus soli TaxID=1500254 RepID=A0A0U5BB69_9BACL|nr:hypothetical protein [Aneurinibacillus soli]PYE63620.1 hypothetical protein DFP93_102307 [Aneurinibacillus soli]BAU27447.1 hypothetical protein CB4_01621 [Aneurinibacillus soli]
MKAKALILLALLCMSSVATAASGGEYLGKYPIVDVKWNGTAFGLDGQPPAIDLEGVTMAPLAELAKKTGAFLSKDKEDGTINVVKPNVNMIVAAGIQEAGDKEYSIRSPFMAVATGSKASFDVFADIDNAPPDSVLVFKIVVRDPSGAEQYVSYPQNYSTARNGTAFLYTHNVKGMDFRQAGDYRVQLIMKRDSDEEYMIVGENLIHAQ